jgi:UDP:flavonoid glycosyltransferase YjiC (YdhE family)
MLGSYEMAEIVANAYGEHDFPEGTNVEKLSNGRTAFRIGNLVYKRDDYDEGENRREYEILTHFKDEPWAPPVELFETQWMDIIVMPYYGERFEETPAEIYDIGNKIERYASKRYAADFIDDLHSGNYRMDDSGGLKIIDAAGCM